jgi:membrane-bound ClpP family serine protease
VDVHGEIWRAVSRNPLAPGESVRVVDINGLTLVVEAVSGPAPEGAHAWKTS